MAKIRNVNLGLGHADRYFDMVSASSCSSVRSVSATTLGKRGYPQCITSVAWGKVDTKLKDEV